MSSQSLPLPRSLALAHSVAREQGPLESTWLMGQGAAGSKACAILVSWEKLLFLCLQSLPHPPSKPRDVLSLEAGLCALSWEDTVSQAHCWAMLPQRCLGVSAPAWASGSHCIAKGPLPTSDYLTHGLGEPGFVSLSH